MARDMRACTRRYTGCGLIFIFPMIVWWFRTSFGRAPFASVTRVSISTREAFFSRWGSLRRSGLMWPWTSLRLFPR